MKVQLGCDKYTIRLTICSSIAEEKSTDGGDEGWRSQEERVPVTHQPSSLFSFSTKEHQPALHHHHNHQTLALHKHIKTRLIYREQEPESPEGVLEPVRV